MHAEADKTFSHFSTSRASTYLQVDTDWESWYTFKRCTADSADTYHWPGGLTLGLMILI